MTNKYKYFVANWKMFGDIRSINSLKKVIKISKLRKYKTAKIIYCPPYTLLNTFVSRLKKTNINVGAQNCHQSSSDGAYTGHVNSQMIKNIGCKYVIIGHSENRIDGDTDSKINKKIKASIENNLNVIFCIGEKIKEKKLKKTKSVLYKQIKKGLRRLKNLNKIVIAYEPVWSIGTGMVPKNHELLSNILYIKKILRSRFKLKNPKVLYGGSVNPVNIKDLRKINQIDGFLIGGASQNSYKFIDIIKKTFI